MGNASTTPTVEDKTVISSPHQLNTSAKQDHNRLEKSEYGIECSCGYICQTEHIYKLHIEHHVGMQGELDPSGWPIKQFETGTT